MKLYGGLTFYIVLCLFGIAIGQNYDVLMQESPAGAGVIKPGVGLHSFGIKENVALTTAANPGYHFVGWLGDVHDPTANRTSLTVDGPKIIIAVFERDEYEVLAPAGPQISVGPPGVFPRYDSYTNSNGVSGSDYPPDNPSYYPPDNPPNDPPPVPEVPEPATVLLLGIGASILTMNRKIRPNSLSAKK